MKQPLLSQGSVGQLLLLEVVEKPPLVRPLLHPVDPALLFQLKQ